MKTLTSCRVALSLRTRFPVFPPPLPRLLSSSSFPLEHPSVCLSAHVRASPGRLFITRSNRLLTSSLTPAAGVAASHFLRPNLAGIASLTPGLQGIPYALAPTGNSHSSLPLSSFLSLHYPSPAASLRPASLHLLSLDVWLFFFSHVANSLLLFFASRSRWSASLVAQGTCAGASLSPQPRRWTLHHPRLPHVSSGSR